MKKFLVLIIVIVISIVGCKGEEVISSVDETVEVSPSPTTDTEETNEVEVADVSLINTDGMTIEERFYPPVGAIRLDVDEDSFGYYLRNLPLKEDGLPVLYYDGRTKSRDVHMAVIDMDVGNRDLQQCADAVMRLRAEYLYEEEKYDEIHFNFTNGFRVDYSKWVEGYRVKVDGNTTTWVKSASENNSYESFRKYMNLIFAYAGTLSLSQELDSKDILELEIGDIFIKGGSPGHSVIVVDMAQNSETGEVYYMIAQSYMPAQEIHILKNNNDDKISPWYRLTEGDINTPEWTFTDDQVKFFE